MRGELEIKRRLQNIDPPPAPPVIAVRLFRSPGCSTGGLGAQPLCWELIPTARSGTLTSSSELRLPDFLSHPDYIIVLRPLNSTRRVSRLSPDLFDRMHLLFTQVHFPFDSLAGVNMQHKYYSKSRPRNWDPQNYLEFWDINESLNLELAISPSNSPRKKENLPNSWLCCSA